MPVANKHHNIFFVCVITRTGVVKVVNNCYSFFCTFLFRLTLQGVSNVASHVCVCVFTVKLIYKKFVILKLKKFAGGCKAGSIKFEQQNIDYGGGKLKKKKT